jgi:DNA repair protein RadC
MLIKDLPAGLRPREKLLAQGPQALADTELVALLLRTGYKGMPVLQLSQRLLDAFGGVAGLMKATAADLRRVKGLGPAKRAEVAALLEIARRSLRGELAARPVLQSPQAVKDYLALHLAPHLQEVFAVLFLDSREHLLGMEEMFRGTLAQTSVYPREVVRRALAHNAAAVILAHNHPSGVAEPSRADELLTQALQRALALIDVKVLDHLVVGRGAVVSLAERGLL